MTWLSNVVVVGAPVDGIAAVKIPLPGSNMSIDANFRTTITDVAILAETPVPPPVYDPATNSFGCYPILSSVRW